ncbi:MAG: alpha/beta hydrolase [Nitrospirae bacterium]|nr:alpha/beta hydrolase [Nitrospirota bacterium]
MLKKTYLILLISVLAISACAFDNRAIRGGDVVDKYNIGEINLPIEEVIYKNIDGSILYAWSIKKANHDRLPTIIFLHGSRGNVFDYLPVIRNLYQNIDANIFACDFPGTGASKGKMGLENSYQMTIAAIDYLTNERNISQDRIVLYGASMGASLAFYGASKREHVLVIVDSGVTSAGDYLKKYTLIGLPDFLIGLFGENFNNYPLVKSLKNPKLILHGKEDRFIDIKYAQRLYEQAAEPKDFSWVKGDHVLFGNTDNSRELSKKVRTFIEAHIPEQGMEQ